MWIPGTRFFRPSFGTLDGKRDGKYHDYGIRNTYQPSKNPALLNPAQQPVAAGFFGLLLGLQRRKGTENIPVKASSTRSNPAVTRRFRVKVVFNVTMKICFQLLLKN